MSPGYRLRRLCLIAFMWTMTAPAIFAALHLFYAVVDTHNRNAAPPHGRTLGRTSLAERILPFSVWPD